MNKKGKVFILGSGCGNMELLTLKGKEVIEKVDCIIYDRLIDINILNFAKKNTQLIYLGKDNTEGGTLQEKINSTLVEKALSGLNVARVKGGDSFVFGRGGEEIEALISHGIEFEIIPGISSSIAVPEYAGIPVTHRNISRSFHVFTGHTTEDGSWHDFETIAKLDGTLIFLMGIKNLSIIVNDLIKNGKNPSTPIAIIENGATTKQKVTTGILENIVTLAKENNISPPAIIIIGEVVKFRDIFQWFEKKELFGKNILVTRDEKQSSEIIKKIQENGGNAFSLSFINIKENKFSIPKLLNYSCLLFNSPNGVREFMKKIRDIRVLANLKIGVVGEKTREVLESFKIIPDFMPNRYTIDELAKISTNFTKKDDKILVITSDISPCNCEFYSKNYERDFEKLVVYKTEKIIRTKEEVLQNIKNIDIITFLSSSTVEAFMESIENDTSAISDIEIASIGPITTATLKKYKIIPKYEADIYSVDGVIKSIGKL